MSKMVTILVAYWRSNENGGIAPGDVTIALPRFPTTDVEVEAVRDIIRLDLEKFARDTEKVTIVNIMRLG
jgi:hypothetical protein